MGTAPRMTVAENLLIAKFRGERRGLFPRRLNHYKEEFQATIDKIGNGLEKHLDTAIEVPIRWSKTGPKSFNGDTQTS